MPAPTLKDRIKAAEFRFRESYGTDVSTAQARRRAWWDFHLMDHAFLRVWWTNSAMIAPDVFRANQPDPARVALYASQGIKTIINLRGVGRHSHYLFERQACAEHGIRLIDHRLFASGLVPAKDLLALHQTFLTAERPVVIHCKSGADRAGLAAALYLMLICDEPVAVAAKQLGRRFLHFRNSTTGVLDFMLEAYASDQARTGIGILDWIRTEYDPVALSADFKAKRGK